MARCYYVNIDPHYDIPDMARIKSYIDEEISKYVISLPSESGNNILYLRNVKKQTLPEKMKKEKTDIFPIILKEDDSILVDVLTNYKYKMFNDSKELAFLTLRLKKVEELLAPDAIKLINSLDQKEREAYKNQLYNFGLAVNRAYRKFLELTKKDLIRNHFDIKQKIK